MNINYIDGFTKEFNKSLERAGVKKSMEDGVLILMDNITKCYSGINERVENNNKKITENLNEYLAFQKKLIDSISKKEDFNILNQNKIVADYIKAITEKTLTNVIECTEDIKKKLV